MAYKVPGFKASTGMKSFEPLVDGEYELQVKTLEVKPPKKPSPTDVWTFEFNVLAGPPQADGKAAKGRRYMEFVSIMQEEHPSFPEWGHIGVDQLKSMALALGVTGKGDQLNPEAFVGTQMKAHIVVEIGKDGKPRNRIASCSALE